MMTMEKAQGIISAGIVKAKEIGQPMNIAVVDDGANLTAFARMDGAWLGSIDIAINKAFTAKAFDIRRWSSAAQPAGRPILRHPRIEPYPGDDFRGWHSHQGERPDRGRRWRQRRQWQTGPDGRRSSGRRVVIVSWAGQISRGTAKPT